MIHIKIKIIKKINQLRKNLKNRKVKISKMVSFLIEEQMNHFKI